MYTLLPLLVILIAFWFLLIRPQQKRQRQMQQMQSEVAPGEEVMLTSGIFGEVREVADDHLVVEIADGVAVKVVRGAIGRVVPREEIDGSADRAEHETHDVSASDQGSVTLDKSTGSGTETPEETLERLRQQGEHE